MFKQWLTLLLLVTAATGTLEAKMYRWTDENGVTVYSQSPPASGQAEVIKPPPPQPKGNTSKDPARDAKPQPTKEMATKPGPSKEEIAESNKLKQKNCEAVKRNLAIYENLGNRLLKTPDGLYKRPTEEERQENIKKNRELMKEYCSK